MAQDNVQSIDIRAWVSRIIKNWYWFLASCFVFGLVGIYLYYSTPRQYEVKSEIMLRDADNGSAFVQTEMLNFMGMGGIKLVDDEIAVLTSRDIISEVISDLNLQIEYRKRDFLKWVGQYPHGDLSMVYSSNFLDTLNRVVNVEINVREDEYVVKVEYGDRQHSKHVVQNLSDPIETCAGTLAFNILHADNIDAGDKYRIKVYPRITAINLYRIKVQVTAAKKDSKVIRISSVTDIPSRARDYIDRLIELYNLDAIADKNTMANNTANFINERVEKIAADLVQAEEQTVQYQAKYGILDPDIEAEIFLTENMEYRKQMSEIETQINWLNFLCEYLEDVTNKDYLLPATLSYPMTLQKKHESMIPSNVGGADIALVAAIEEYNSLMIKRMRIERTAMDENPLANQMDEQLAVLRANIIGTVKNLRKALLISKQDLDNQFAEANKKRADMPDHVRTYEKMVREKEFLADMYLFVCEQREENAMLMAAAVMPAKMVTKPQTDLNPIRPRMDVIMLLCIILGVVFPIGIMVLYDVLNNRISSNVKDLEKRLKVPFAGVLVKNDGDNRIVVGEGENNISAELFRTLRTNIGFMQPSSVKSPVILVTSSINNEGKSYVATNLALSMALLGKKVVLVGLDIRKPMLADYLNLTTQGCLTNYLSDTSYSFDDVIVASNTSNLDVIPAGIIPPNPGELMQSNRLDELFAELRKRYDYVLVDTAPIGMVSDTFLLNRVADMTIYVTRANQTTFDLIDLLNQTHEQQRLPKMVAVLNAASVKNIGYGYGYGYGNNAKAKK